MNWYKIVIAYDGTDFHGWQVQPSDETVMSVLEKTFTTAFSRSISLVGASRTDAGVHALGQVALCGTDLSISPDQIMYVWNNALPKSIVIRSIEQAPQDFHIFAHVSSKTYYYHLFYERPLPFIARYGWFWKFIESVDFEKFRNAMDCFVGEHDFRSFCKHENGQKTVRTIDSIAIEKYERFGAVRATIKSSGFLRYQIRRMVGAALDVARKRELPVDAISHHLKHPNDQQEFTRAAGCGLCLRKIIYGKGGK
ncbi:tRNA pseudouridine(38-40) synthase TruA [Candidatus Dependentiae bacterium]|nr:tRNA pseudouridine(38-40) synthase TruA [Candidatus Dependentiae bacterium]